MSCVVEQSFAEPCNNWLRSHTLLDNTLYIHTYVRHLLFQKNGWPSDFHAPLGVLPMGLSKDDDQICCRASLTPLPSGNALRPAFDESDRGFTISLPRQH